MKKLYSNLFSKYFQQYYKIGYYTYKNSSNAEDDENW